MLYSNYEGCNVIYLTHMTHPTRTHKHIHTNIHLIKNTKR
jgi:hypothetical protein